ncbi:MAG: hypothetical protein A2252_10010 [Elusimicrobia bacterium RIFOXYA2_FULL_39_19]|nr:MAG: hypothetical protein A2252_10010 [Elusimicrobia bacterium RIFOXYA2_FULL_39_19]
MKNKFKTIICAIFILFLCNIMLFATNDIEPSQIDYFSAGMVLQGHPGNLVELLLVSPDGKKIGYDVKKSTIVNDYDPVRSSYFLDGYYELNAGEIFEEWNNLDFHGKIVNGRYVLNVIGKKTGIYRITMFITGGNIGGSEINGIISSGDIHEIYIDFKLPADKTIIKKAVDFMVLKKEFEHTINEYKNDKELYRNMIKQFDILTTKLNEKEVNSFVILLNNAKNIIEKNGIQKPSFPLPRVADKKGREQMIKWRKYNKWYKKRVVPLDILIKDAKTILDNMLQK